MFTISRWSRPRWGALAGGALALAAIFPATMSAQTPLTGPNGQVGFPAGCAMLIGPGAQTAPTGSGCTPLPCGSSSAFTPGRPVSGVAGVPVSGQAQPLTPAQVAQLLCGPATTPRPGAPAAVPARPAAVSTPTAVPGRPVAAPTPPPPPVYTPPVPAPALSAPAQSAPAPAAPRFIGTAPIAVTAGPNAAELEAQLATAATALGVAPERLSAAMAAAAQRVFPVSGEGCVVLDFDPATFEARYYAALAETLGNGATPARLKAALGPLGPSAGVRVAEPHAVGFEPVVSADEVVTLPTTPDDDVFSLSAFAPFSAATAAETLTTATTPEMVAVSCTPAG